MRELENLIHREYLLSPGEMLAPPTSPDLRDSQESCPPLQGYRAAKVAALAEFDRRFLQNLLQHTRGNVTAAAQVASKERRALGRLLRKYDLRPEQFKTA